MITHCFLIDVEGIEIELAAEGDHPPMEIEMVRMRRVRWDDECNSPVDVPLIKDRWTLVGNTCRYIFTDGREEASGIYTRLS